MSAIRHHKNHANDRWLFLRKFLRHGTGIASITPSSRWLSRGIARAVPANARVVLELGGGTGPFTQALVNHLHPGCRLIVVERDADFHAILTQRFPKLEIVRGDAADFGAMLGERGIAKVDHIVSGLPFAVLTRPDQERLMQNIANHLAPGGYFLQLTEFPLIFYPVFKRYFRDVRFRPVLRNIPPLAGFYECRHPISPV